MQDYYYAIPEIRLIGVFTMTRAAVLIGVRKAGNLPELQAVYPGISRMRQWAKSQGIDGDLLQIITDEDGRDVDISRITKAVDTLTSMGTVEQLIIYFAGHGIHNRGEKWLLSQAPGWPSQAVNVDSSEYLARYCGIPHVVFISDACRTAPDSIQAGSVTGSDIFPDFGNALDQPVDLFFACARGKPALEVRDPLQAATEFRAVYTEVLTDCLEGRRFDLLEVQREGNEDIGLIRPRKLEDCLVEAVPQRLKELLHKTPRINQTPTARITSRDSYAWLSRVKITAPSADSGSLERACILQSLPPGISPFSISTKLFASAIAGDRAMWSQVKEFLETSTLGGGHEGSSREASLLKAAIDKLNSPFGPSHFETSCGFKIRGAQVATVHCRGVRAEVINPDGTLIRVFFPDQVRAANVLLELRDGNGVVLPAIPQFLAELTFESTDERTALVDVRYEPSENSPRWGDFHARREELRELSASIAAATELGIFRLTEENALKLAGRMQIAKGVDPSMSVYAAYAYHNLHRTDLIQQMQDYLRDDLGLAFYDLSLLSGAARTFTYGGLAVVPPFPMLSQGWSLLSVLRAGMPDSFRRLETRLRPSLWTLFDSTGVQTLIAAMAQGEL